MMIPSSTRFYENGSLAHQVDQDYASRKKEVLKKQKVSYTGVKAKLMFWLLIGFSVGMTLMFRYAQITDLNYKIQNIRVEIDRLTNENLVSRVEIQSALDLTRVRSVVKEEWGMFEPRREQIVIVQVPKSNYNLKNEELYQQAAKTEAVIVRHIEAIGRTLGLLAK